MGYELCHDESRQFGYWHGMFLVPIGNKGRLLKLLARTRSNVHYPHPIKFSKVKRPGRIASSAESWAQIGVAALMSRLKDRPAKAWLGQRTGGRRDYELFNDAAKPVHRVLAQPVKTLVERYRQGPARMQNSRWRGSLCMSQCSLENGEWRFETIEYLANNSEQGQLPPSNS